MHEKSFGGGLHRQIADRKPDVVERMSVRLATDPSLAGVTGRFFTSTPGMRFLPSVRDSRDAGLQRRVWERTSELVGLSQTAAV